MKIEIKFFTVLYLILGIENLTFIVSLMAGITKPDEMTASEAIIPYNEKRVDDIR